MEQEIKRIYYTEIDKEVSKMKKFGYYVKQISNCGEGYYLWILFEKLSNDKVL